ncbi:unnamed protein product [Prorocentrum cordatum]|uniref:Subtilisin n=1 Tax=Prorocentrum cordatum TaxID=2364126 RepID=A0ABN9U0F5_9DINO|nr:unnamed protein product [Polarella glacialis]
MTAHAVLLSLFLQSGAELLPSPDSCLIQITSAAEGAERQRPQTTAPPTAAPTAAPTPSPTVAPGQPCPCLKDACFEAYDRDSDQCLREDECAVQAPLTNCSSPTWDLDGDGCVNLSVEWPLIFDMTNGSVCPVEARADAPECGEGYYLDGNPVACIQCTTGATRRRRSFECSACESGAFDAGDYDDCRDGSYLPSDVGAGDFNIPVTPTDPPLSPGDCIDIVSMSQSGACNQSVETVCIESVGPGNEVTLTTPLQNNYTKYAGVIISCTTVDGTELSRKHDSSGKCGCKSATCDTTTMCSIGADNCTATCIPTGPYPIHPTPAPTVGAKGDPHLVNLQGEHFDINHGGDFVLLRLPQDSAKDAELELLATVQPEFKKPCTTYITRVELSGSWLGNVSVQATLARGRAPGGRLHEPLGAEASPWQSMEAFLADGTDLVLSAPYSNFHVSLSKSQWFPKKETVQARNAPSPAKIVIRQDLPEQEHLNLAVQRVSALGRMDVGGLLGFDAHPASLEYVSGRCEHHRATEKYSVESQEDNGYYYTPVWKQRWQEMKKKRKLDATDEDARDNDAAATLIDSMGSSSNLVCKCPTAGGPWAEGIVIEEPTALFAEASWD